MNRLPDTDTALAVRLDAVEKTYAEDGFSVIALAGMTADIPRGRFVMIVGPSGSGKSTLLNLIGCIDRPTKGSIEVAGQRIADLSDDALTDFRARAVGFVFQNFNLFPVLSAYENVEYPLLLLGLLLLVPLAVVLQRARGEGRPQSYCQAKVVL